MGFGINYLTPIDNHVNSAVGIKPSVNLKTSKNITWFIDFNFSKHRHEEVVVENRVVNNFEFDNLLVNFGPKIFPDKLSGFYIKPSFGLDYIWRKDSKTTSGNSLNFGIGKYFEIKNKLNFYVESEVLYHFKLLNLTGWYSTFDINLSSGIQIKL